MESNIKAVPSWFGTEEYQIAMTLYSCMKKEMPNPTYRQVERVLECMKDLAKDASCFNLLKEI